MPSTRRPPWVLGTLIILSGIGWIAGAAVASDLMQAGVAVRDVTPQAPIWLAGYAARTHPATNADTPLLVQALALQNPTGERLVFVTLDNCEVSGDFIAPTLRALEQAHGLARGAVMIVCSHTHSGPVLEGSLLDMYPLSEADREAVVAYGRKLKTQTAEVVDAALAETQPAVMEHGVGQAAFATNRRVQGDKAWGFGDNPKGPVDRDVPVLKIADTNGTVRAILFGYACHATSIQGEDFYTVSGDYIAYARRHLEAVYPGARAMFLTGMGADANPSPRGSLLQSKRHGLELAGAVVSVLQRPMRAVRGPFQLAYAEPELPFQPAPPREQLEQESRSENRYVKNRTLKYLNRLDEGNPVAPSLNLPVAVVRLGEDLTFLAMGGEVVVDYALEFKRRYAGANVWTVGYAYEIPGYIPSRRVLQEGGYEADSSLLYYGRYGPFRPEVETILVRQMQTLVDSLDRPR